MRTEDNNKGKPVPHAPGRNTESPGYETEDVSISGIVTFLAGLSGFILIFFFFCFVMGKAINNALIQHDGKVDKWHVANTLGATPHGDKREDLASNPVMEQRELGQLAQAFPTPRLETDDGNQDLTDLHSREDLLLDNYSTSADLPAGTIRIPIARAMELVLHQGLPAAQAAPASATLMAGETKPVVTAPLTNGFARTGYELDHIVEREQKLEFARAQGKRE